MLAPALLFAPASSPRLVAGLGRITSATLVLDLEDTVAPEDRDAARERCAAFIAEHPGTWVRLSGPAPVDWEPDLDKIVRPGLDGVVLPKVDASTNLASLDAGLARREQAVRLPTGAVSLLPLIESARGLLDIEQGTHAGVHRIVALGLGTADLGLDLRVVQTSGTLDQARMRLAIAARARGLPKVYDGPFLRFRDIDGLAQDCARSRAWGLTGRVVVHPGQVPVVSAAYDAVDDAELAARIVAAFEAAGPGTAIDVDGVFVDEPVYRSALHVLSRTDQEKR